MKSLLVVPIDPAPLESFGMLKRELEQSFGLPVSLVSASTIDTTPAYDASRNQYYSSFLLSALVKQYPTHEGKLLGITKTDLYVPVLTYVFGEAQLNGMAAIVSSYRLDDALYGLPPNRGIFEDRLMKEAVHELGHTFGLLHCRQFDCVMHSSTAVEEIDLKSVHFCPLCRSALPNLRKV
ncbi:MAG: archaemetzincin family Zn-dependent metalloprotease [Ignavibacteriales bacterium]|nr:archaemetzincin family Zn-dependent metalloprotease [Ignavibacteriales bacterium]